MFAAFCIQGLRCDGWSARAGGKDFMGSELYRYRRGVALMFFLVFAQSILGSRTIHSQLEALLRQSRQMCEQLKQIAQHLEKEKEKDKSKN